MAGLRAWYAQSASPERFRAVADGSGPVASIVAEDHVLENIDEAPVTTPYAGPEGMRQWVRDTREAVDDAWIELLELEEAAASAYVAKIRLHGRIGGIESDFVWYALHRLVDGRLIYTKGYLSKDDALAAA
jgi:hypothetical protein